MIVDIRLVAPIALICLVACESKVDRYQRLTREHEMAVAENLHAVYQSDSIDALVAALPAGPSPRRDSLEAAKHRIFGESLKMIDREEKLRIELHLMDGDR